MTMQNSSGHARGKWLYSREWSGDVLRDTLQRSAAGAAARQSLDHQHLVRQSAPRLASTRRIIAVEQQGHGHTADMDRPFNLEQWAQDTSALLHHLGIE